MKSLSRLLGVEGPRNDEENEVRVGEETSCVPIGLLVAVSRERDD